MEEFIINNFLTSKINKYTINIIIILSFIVLSFVSVFFLLNNHILYIGWDTQFHFKRIVELSESILRGNLFPDFSFNEFHGSVVMSLYPYLNLFPASLLFFIIKSKINLVYTFFIFNTLLSFIISFYSCKDYVKSYSISYFFSIIYSLSNIFLTHYFIMSDLGLVSSYIFLPLVIFGVIQLIQKNNKWLEFSIGIVLILYSHIINFILLTFFILIFLIINIKKIDKNIFKKLLKSLILFLIMSSIIWLPFLNIYITNLGNINLPIGGVLDKINIKLFMSGLLGNRNNNTIGFFPIIAIFIFPFFYKNFNRYIKQIYSLSIIIIIFTLFFPLRFITSHNIFKFLDIFQFTWRFLFIPQMILSFIFALIAMQYMKMFNIKKAMYFFIILLTIFLQLFVGQYITIIGKNSNNPFFNNIPNNNIFVDMHKIFNYRVINDSQFNLLLNIHYIADDDYIPKSSLHLSQYVNHDIGFYDNVHEIKVKHIGYNTFNFSGNNINKISLPIYVYNKEQLHVYLNNKLVNNYADKNGLLTINDIHNDIKPNNKIYIKPKIDLFRFIGAILSILGWLFILGIIIKNFIDILNK